MTAQQPTSKQGANGRTMGDIVFEVEPVVTMGFLFASLWK